MSIVERKQRHRQALRREILDAARQMFVEDGYESVTMRRLAERIEYSPTTIYLHFRDKDELFHAVCEETFRELRDRLGRLARKGLPPRAFLREGLRLYVDFGLKHPGHYTLTFTQAAAGRPDQGYDDSIGKQAFEYLRNAVAACVEAGELPRIDVEASAQALWAAAHGLVSLLIAHTGFPFVARRALVDHTIDTMIAGLRAR
jgi:AcrR family transcriptional regulator